MQLKRVFPFLLLTATTLVASSAPQLTDAQKYEAMRLYVENSQLQDAQKNIQETSKQLQAKFQELSAACGKDASLSFAPDDKGQMEPSCKVNTPPPAPESPKK